MLCTLDNKHELGGKDNGCTKTIHSRIPDNFNRHSVLKRWILGPHSLCESRAQYTEVIGNCAVEVFGKPRTNVASDMMHRANALSIKMT